MEGVRGSQYVSDIAIDDVAILQGDECNVKNSTSATLAAIDTGELLQLMFFNTITICFFFFFQILI